MITTLPAFKMPGFNDQTHGFTNWRMVELTDGSPWFVVSLIATDGDFTVPNTLFVSFMADVVGLIETQAMGKVTALQMLKSPWCSPTKDWEIRPIQQVYVSPKRHQESRSPVVFIDREGSLWAGADMELADKATLEGLDLLASFDQPTS